MSEKLDFKVQQIQFVLFPINLNILNIDKTKLANDLKTKTGVLFDGESMVMPLQAEAPAGIPRIILRSKNNIYRCAVAISRIDFFFKGNEDKEFKDLKKDFLLKAKQIYSYFIEDLKEHHLPIGRIGFVVDFIADLGEKSANKILREHLLNKDSYFFKIDTDHISLVFTEKFTIDTWRINRLIRFDSLSKATTPDKDDTLALKYDINTVSEKLNDYNLSVTNIEKIIEKASAEMGGDLNKFLE